MRKAKPIPLTLEQQPDPKPDTLYGGRIKQVSAKKESISVTVEHLDTTLAGCLQHAHLPKDMYLGNKTHRFVLAAGFDIDIVGMQIDDLRQAIGRTVGMRFVSIGDGYEIEFEKVTTKAKAKTATKTGSSEASDTESVGDLDGVPDPEDDFLSI